MKQSITGKTGICGVIGDPIEHTLSPAMHNAAYVNLGLDYVYLPFRVRVDDLRQAIEGMRAFNIRGLNVTIPHKVAVMQYLDKIDELAEKICAVNTIVNDDGILTGYNTDASGFLRPLLERKINPQGKNVVIIGAGGASRAISFILAEKGTNLNILNRCEELEWAVKLADRISQTFDRPTKASELNESNLKKALATADILINATSVGMIPHEDKTPVSENLLRPGLTVYDVVYNPLKTRLLEEAEKAGATTLGGIEMLAWQGASAFELWLGIKAPVNIMKTATIEALRNHEK
ncbi:shikimate dehydrogenase [Chloroflexota bacterium]